VGGYFDGATNHGFTFDGSTYTQVDFPGTAGNFANTINNEGQIVGEYSLTDPNVSTGRQGFLFGSNSLSAVVFAGAAQTEVFGINNNGEIVGDYYESSGTVHGFLLSGGTYTTLDFPGAAYTAAETINDTGQIVGLYNTALSTWDAHGFVATPISGHAQLKTEENNPRK
jgi:uncharacterized membrane protein